MVQQLWLVLELLLQFTKRAEAEKLKEIFLKVCFFAVESLFYYYFFSYLNSSVRI